MAKKIRRISKRKISGWIILIVGITLFFTLGGNDESSEEVNQLQQPSDMESEVILHSLYVDSILNQPRQHVEMAEKRRPSVGYRFRTGYDYRQGFPDLNDLQLATATRLGIATIADRQEALERKDELVYVGENPFYVIDDLDYSIPYLIPRAARLLDEICRSFVDSLASRGLPFYKPLVTSILRTQKDVKRLRRVNCNASANSCHQYGTTFDIAYNKFFPVFDPQENRDQNLWPAELKQVLAEVLDDLRKKGLCYIRYEVHQPCFHITAR